MIATRQRDDTFLFERRIPICTDRVAVKTTGPLPVGSYRAHVETQGADSDQQDKAMEETMRASVARREEAQGMDGNSPDTRDKKEKKDVDVRSPSPTVVHRVAVTVSAGVPPSVDKTGTMTIVGEKEVGRSHPVQYLPSPPTPSFPRQQERFPRQQG